MNETGFSFKINPLFLLVMTMFVIVGMIEEALVAFAVVFIHELAHMIIAGKIGYNIYKIELFPFGGMAEYKGLLEMEPWQEIKIALAGPLSNFFLTGFFFMLNYFIEVPYYELIIKYNLILGCFNMIPALPLDGGRILRGFLVNKFGFKRGTRAAIKLAQILAVIGVIIGFLAVFLNRTNIWFLFISFFVYGAALKEQKQILYNLLNYLTRRQEYVNQMQIKPVSCKMVKGSMLLEEVISYIIPGKYNIFYILDNKACIAGVISEVKLLNSFFSMKENNRAIIELVAKDGEKM